MVFGFGKKKKVLDLTERYKIQVAAAEQAKKTQAALSSGSNASPFAFFDSPGATDSSNSEIVDLSDAEERKRRLAKRITDMTENLEDLSNQIYHLQQRLEVLERKNDIRRFDSA